MSKKYNIAIAQEDNGWAASIIRKVSAKKTTVTKAQEGFGSEDEAKTWAETELKSLLELLAKRNKRDSK